MIVSHEKDFIRPVLFDKCSYSTHDLIQSFIPAKVIMIS